MTQLEILELALLGTAYLQSVASKEYAKAVICAVADSSSSNAQKTYWLDVCERNERDREEVFRLISEEREKTGGNSPSRQRRQPPP